MRIYISGPITGTTDYMERFAAAEDYLMKEGYVCINPAKVNAGLPSDTTHEEYMKTSICMLHMCDAIYMLEGWQQSEGCAEELSAAIRREMMIVFEGGKVGFA